MKNFEYLDAKSLEEACSLLGRYGRAARVIAGGTDLILAMKERMLTPRYLVNIKSIPGLSGITWDNCSGLRIGALVKVAEILESPVVKKNILFNALVEAAKHFGSVQIRNLATIGGNICHAAPSAEFGPPLLALGARVKIVGSKAQKSIPIEEFFTGPGTSVLKHDEILKEITIPNVPNNTRSIYLSFTPRKAMDLAIANVAIALSYNSERVLFDVKVGLGAVASTPIRAKKTEQILEGKAPNGELIQTAAEAASKEINPRRASFRSSPEYRREIVKVLVRRGLVQLLSTLEGSYFEATTSFKD